MAKRAAQLAGIRAEIEQRIGLCPAFFRTAEHSVERTDFLWRQARESYLDNPLPSLFKEKLFAYLSRFSSSPYCMARHAAFLLGRGRVAGDRAVTPLAPDEVVALLRKPYPLPAELAASLRCLEAAKSPLRTWPRIGGEIEAAILTCATPVFLRRTEDDGNCLPILRRCLGHARWEHLLALLAFIRSAHFWTENHPELSLEEDVIQLLTELPALDEWVRSYARIVREELSVSEGIGILASRDADVREARAESPALATCRENEDRLKFALEISHTGIWDLNLTDHSAFRSLEHDRIFGYREMLPRWTYEMFLDHVLPEERAAVDASFRQALRTRGNWSFECRIRRVDGAVRWIRAAGAYRPKSGDKRARMTGIVRDITALKEAEAARNRSVDLQQLIFRSLPTHIAVVAPDGTIVAVNDAWTRFAEDNGAAGAPAVCLGANYLDVCRRSLADGDASAASALAGIESVLDGQAEQFTLEYPCHSPAEERWFSMTVVPIRDRGRGGAIVSHLNVTERKQAEAALRRSEAESKRQREFLECLVEHAGCCIAVVQGTDLRFTLVNPAYQAIVPGAPLLGRAYREMFPEAAAAGAEARCREVLATGKPWVVENYRAQIPGGVDACWHGHVVRLPVRPGEEASLLVVVWEVTERIRAEEALRQSEARYRGLVEQALDGIFVADPAGVVRAVNAAGARMWGFQVEELLGMRIVEAVMPEEVERIPAEIAKLRDGSVKVTEWLCRRKDGSCFVGEVVGRLLPDGSLQAIVRDITERHQARLHAEFLNRLHVELVNESDPARLVRGALRLLAAHLGVDQASLGYFCAEGAELKIVASLRDGEGDAPRSYRTADFGNVDLLQVLAIGKGITICDTVSDPRTASRAENYRRLGVASLACEPFTGTDGLKAAVTVVSSQPRHWRADELQLLREAASRIFGAFEQAQARAELQASEERFRLAVKATNDAIWDFDLVSGRVSWNENYARLYGRTEETANSLEWWIEHIHPADRDRAVDSLRQAIDGQESLWVCEYRFQRKDGGWAFIDDRGYIVREPTGRAVRVFGAMHDLTERKRAEMALRASEERLRLAQVAAGVGIWEWNPGTGALEWTSELERIFGYEVGAFPGTLAALAERVHPEDWETVRDQRDAAIRDHRDFNLDHRVRLPSGELRWINCKGAAIYDVAGHPERVFAASVDVTARKEAEMRLEASLAELQRTQSELMRRERLALLGQLAGSLAHELRTPLSVILNSIYFLEQMLPAANDTFLQVLAEMRRAVGNSDSIISEMQEYVREPHPQRVEFRIGDAIAHALHMVSLPETVHLQPMAPAMEAVLVYASLEQVTRILVNLIRNAIQAMPQGGGLEFRAGDEGDELVCVEVRDTGCGIPAAIQEKIFEPLFSTKVTGIGLGLSIALRYARFNGGDLCVESTEGEGTTFRLFLPSGAVPQTATGT